MNASFQSALARKRVASGLKCWPMPQCRHQPTLSVGLKSLRTDNTVVLSAGSGCIDLKRPTETLCQTERREKKAGCMMISMRGWKPCGFLHSVMSLYLTVAPLLFTLFRKTTLIPLLLLGEQMLPVRQSFTLALYPEQHL